MAPVTCDTQAYFNILFPSISFFFLSCFFVLLQNLSPLLFAIFEVPRIVWGVGMQVKCLMVSSKIANLRFSEANLLHF